MDEKLTPAPEPTANGAAEAADSAAEAADEAQLRQDLDQLRAERDRFLDLLQRTQADFENYQKRVARDRADERRYAYTALALDLLPALDNLERALASVQAESPLSQGVAMVRTQLLAALARHGITPIDAVGQPFDPHRHEAVQQEPSTEHPPNTVLRVLEPGYAYHDRVLRPSKVVVSKAPEGEGV
jgi:molecular chaperone GrpE